EHRGLEPAPAAVLARRGHRLHEAELGVDDARALALGARALGVGAEQRGLDPVRLREGLADRLQEARVRGGVGAARPLDRALVDRHDALARRDRALDERALARA